MHGILARAKIGCACLPALTATFFLLHPIFAESDSLEPSSHALLLLQVRCSADGNRLS